MLLSTKNHLSALKCHVLVIIVVMTDRGAAEESGSPAIFKASVSFRRHQLPLSLEDRYIRLHTIDSASLHPSWHS